MTVRALVIAIAVGIGCSHGGAPAAKAPEASTVVAVGVKAPDAELTAPSGSKVALAEALRSHPRNVVVFYRGFWCQTCVRWLGELASHAAELDQRGIGIVAIAADNLADMASLQPRLPRITLLTDAGLVAATAWGLHVRGAEAPSPGTFVLDKDGVVSWRHLEGPRGDWPTYPELIAALP